MSTKNSIQETYGGGDGDAFIAKLSAAGDGLVYSIYLGGTHHDSGRGIAVDSEGCAYVTGVTCSEDFPTRNPYQATSAGNDDAFVAKLSEDGTTLAYSTYLGGTSYDVGEGIAVDSEGCAYITGFAGSGDFPTTDATFQDSLLREADAYVARLCFEIKDDEQPPAAPHRGGAAYPVRTVLLASVLAGGLLMLRRRMAQI